MRKTKLIFLFSALILSGCKGVENSIPLSPSLSGSALASTDTSSSAEEKKAVRIDKYVSQVSDTLPYLLSKKDQGKDVNYVVTSYPVIANARAKDSSLSVYGNVRTLFSEKYSTSGFPQAGLFIKKSLAKDKSKEGEILSFLKAFDSTVDELISAPSKVKETLDKVLPGDEAQKNKLGRTSSLALSVQKEKKNGFGFLSFTGQPDQEEYDRLKEPFSLNWQVSSFSSFYGRDLKEEKARENLSFSLITPSGAPSLAFAPFAGSENFVTAAPNRVKSEFAKGEKDFIVFDSVNGRNLQGDKYEFVSRVTYGNLYVVSLGNDSNEVREDDDYIVGYGEGLIPDLAFKAVYQN